MFEKMKGYIIYMIFISIITIPIFLIPVFFYNSQIFEDTQGYYTVFCHQITSRSYCYFPDSNQIENCYDSSEFNPSKESIVEKSTGTGYKFPVCARDTGFYLFAFLGGIALFFLKKYKSDYVPHPIWLILAIIPMALDGGTQLIGLQESTNIIRFTTGAIAGIALPFYMVPILNRFF
ncbi:MAG: DUF2085 domain-containing protein [Candidatus Micrarchaeia archaeon]